MVLGVDICTKFYKQLHVLELLSENGEMKWSCVETSSGVDREAALFGEHQD